MKTLMRSLALLLFVTSAVQADLTISSIIGDNMVIQRDQPVVLWGWDEAGQDISVSMGGAKATSKAADDGSWSVSLPALAAGGPHEITFNGSSDVTIKNVLVGEVWLCSGQSNMEWTVAQSLNPQEEIKAGTHPRIRHIKFPHVVSDKPIDNARTNGWTETTPQTVAGYTAVGYAYARFLQKELDVPVGIIGCNWGGTRIEPWTPPVGFQSVEALKDIADDLANYPLKNDKGQVQVQTPLAIYNAMVHPILKFRFKGAIWYQGESNNGEGMLYHEKMKALIYGWRKVFNNPDMPFYFVQLAPYRYNRPEALPGIWEAQLATLSVEGTGMAVTTDIGNVGDIHPKNKQEVGRRLSLWALTHTYSREVGIVSGPLYKSMKIEGNKVRISFDYTDGRLAANDGKDLSWFTIKGKDGEFVEAKAVIDGQTVLVSSDEVEEPVAVRLGWNELAEPNLVNAAGLPASPFRTDR